MNRKTVENRFECLYGTLDQLKIAANNVDKAMHEGNNWTAKSWFGAIEAQYSSLHGLLDDLKREVLPPEYE